MSTDSGARHQAQKLSYSVGFGVSETSASAINQIPVGGAWVIEFTGLVDLSSWSRVCA